jgi:hypothetical protein
MNETELPNANTQTPSAAVQDLSVVETVCNLAAGRACDHHANELAPAASELQHLLRVVTQLVDTRTSEHASAIK